MTNQDLNQITSARADFGRLTTSAGQTVEFIDLHLGYAHGGTHHTAPVLTMSPDQARNLAMALTAAADKAAAADRSARPPSH